MDTLLSFAFITGLLGGFGHCIGMCGPVIVSYPSAMLPHLLFGAGRITTYAFIGSLMGLTGHFINTAGNLAGLQNLALLLVGVVMVGAGLRMVGVLNFFSPERPVASGILKAAWHIDEIRSVWKYYLLGILLGFMPCGLSGTVFLSAAGAGGPLQGMATMLSFGVGTLPAMLMLGSVIRFIGARARRIFLLAGGALVIIMGCVFLVRGVRLYVDL